MSIRHSLLALLHGQPRYGYELRVEFEDRTGAAWPLNIGQVYTTLDRLERDGLVTKEGDDGGGHVIYSLTEAGAEQVRAWFSGAVDRGNPPRNEIAIKLALAVTMPGVDVSAVIQSQREASLRALQEHTQSRKSVGANQRPADTAWLLVLDSLIFQAEAEVRWLDLCEARMVQFQPGGNQ
ncbi:PadR family transcriptional regulator [Arthrobacter sp. fls2-241-R2A-200]|uniref:PadR family transcriptional regulator n=1 Tax=Arthrobacter sp. fls2-241-R2A-200 TaxID=3040281 RepID=UPI002549C9C7|nr:PadR family transcriptional regulator [Arthrobacter sp. fls2-241-R2A-200]